MPSREPSWWHLPRPTLAAQLLTPASFFYGVFAARRMRRVPAFRSLLPVVCIGNFTAGGTGKTPLAIALAKRLASRGFSPVFLTRGYGSQARAPTLVDVSRHTSTDVGDEALLLARAASVMVSPDRAAGALAIADLGLTYDLILMDDGLQNPSLAKDLSIAVVDGSRGLGNGLVIPAGPLRAPFADQLAQTHAIVVNGRREDRERFAQAVPPNFSGPVFTAHQAPSGDTAWLSGSSVLAFAGIGNPQRFYRLLQQLGARVLAERSFPDHHAFTETDAAALLSEAKRLGAKLVTTEKDFVRLTGTSGARAELARATAPVAISVAFDGDGEERLLSLIIEAVHRRRAAQPAG